MNRRGFLGTFAAAAAALVLDPEKALWRPGEKKIFIPPASVPGEVLFTLPAGHYGWVQTNGMCLMGPDVGEKNKRRIAWLDQLRIGMPTKFVLEDNRKVFMYMKIGEGVKPGMIVSGVIDNKGEITATPANGMSSIVGVKL